MNGYHKLLIAVGVVLCLMPFIAIPYGWKGILAAVLGFIVLIATFMVSQKKHTSDLIQ